MWMLSRIQREALLKIARFSLLDLRIEPPSDPELNTRRSTFVSIYNNKDLRGCIGCVTTARPLWESVKLLAKESATKDPRFEPLSHNEAWDVTVEISVLSSFAKMKSPDEIIIGQDGLYLRHHDKSGLLLPKVAVEHSLDRYSFLEQLSIKANLKKDGWRGAGVSTFQAEIFSIKPPRRVLFASIRNAARSQIAEALALKLVPHVIRPFSAGSDPATKISPVATKLLSKLGISLVNKRPRGFQELGMSLFDTVILIECPESSLPSIQGKRIVWNIKDLDTCEMDTAGVVVSDIQTLVYSLSKQVISEIVRA